MQESKTSFKAAKNQRLTYLLEHVFKQKHGFQKHQAALMAL